MTYSISLRTPFTSTKIRALVSPHLQRLNSIRHHHSQIPAQIYDCDADAEPLHRYRPGGYHPLLVGDVLNDGRYKILHKLGWGGFATTWAAKDRKDNRYVAVKITKSEVEESRELKVLRAISAAPQDHPGSAHVNRMLDHFTLVGPNGTHDCLVLELLGPNVQDIVQRRCKGSRLSSKLAKVFAKQALQGLDFLAVNDIGHGDLHARNLAIVVPDLDSLTEEDFIARLGKPQISAVTKKDGGPLPHNVPSELVWPASFQRPDTTPSCPLVKIIDFGEAFLSDNAPSTLNTPLYLQAPEIVFGDQLDRRVDLWSAGCLVRRTHPFNLEVVNLTDVDFRARDWATSIRHDFDDPPVIIGQMIERTSDELPTRWQAKWHAMQQDAPQQDGGLTLKKWLEELYFDSYRQAEFTPEEVAEISEAIAAMLRLEPSLRATPSESLAQAWFQ